MTINFYLDKGDKTLKITSFENMVSNPFNVGDIIELYVNELDSTIKNSKDARLEQYKELDETLHNKKVKLVEVEKYVQFDNFTEPELTISYCCDFV